MVWWSDSHYHYFEAEVKMGFCSNIQLVSSPPVSHHVTHEVDNTQQACQI